VAFRILFADAAAEAMGNLGQDDGSGLFYSTSETRPGARLGAPALDEDQRSAHELVVLLLVRASGA
jgi:hypothetical protein